MLTVHRMGRRALLGAIGAAAIVRPGWADAVLLRVGDQKGGAESLMKAADALGGLPYRIAWNQFAAAAPVLEALNAGAVDLALAGDAPVTFALAAGMQARIVGATRSSGAGTAIVVPNGSPIRALADLKGRSVGVNRGSIGHALVLAVAVEQGWGTGGIKVVNLLPNEAKTAVSTGAIDAWSSWGVYIAQATLVDGYRTIVDATHGRLSGLSYVVATEAAIADKRAALLDFNRRLAAARRWAADNHAAYAAVLAREIGVSEPVTRLMLDTETPLPVPLDRTVIADQQRTADLYRSAGLIAAPLDAARIFDASFNAVLAG